MISGVCSAVFGFGLHSVVSRYSAEPSAVFQKFRTQNQFNIEYDISQGNFEKVETRQNGLEIGRRTRQSSPNLEFFKQIMGATRRKFSDANLTEAGTDGYALNP